MTNRLLSIAVTCIATAGTSVILTGALVGAAVGAGVATAAIAVSDAKSRTNRGALDAIYGVAGGALFGAVAGAAIAAAPFAAEFYTPLINVQLGLWGIEGANIGIGMVTAGFYGITGLNALFIANNVAAMNSGYDFLGNTVFQDHPDIYMGAQLLTAFASMNILGAGLAVEASERSQGQSQSQTFPEDPDDFNPSGLTRRVFNTRNGKIYKWFTSDNVAVYEWDEDYECGAHYHVIGPDGNTRIPNDSGETHFKPGDNIPSP